MSPLEMKRSATISLEPDLPSSDVETLFDHLAKSGELHAPPRNYQSLNLILRDKSGNIRGGLLGSIAWDWLQIDLLWVEESFRGNGYGRELMVRAEAYACSLGCHHAKLDSFDFGALSLYEKAGYCIFGQLEGFPAGHTQYFLRKDLRAKGD